ncbi:MAPEG family protein [Sphingomonas sp. RIT328]|uniref:MAPEG family protein n=1 Tax=Sphingomonas sp. RIT328 TaxID=1470591 RepID=UPI000448ED83|nr:MAPEG family protein [Sphingomonas sp. RIT328]EZP57287.1 putative membrane protein [Sphingomonas sp. RIT328]
MATEMIVLAASIVLLVVHIMLQGQTATHDRGLAWNAGPRDEGDVKPLGVLAGRAARALANFQETYPAFLALALGLAATGQTGGLGAIGALVWLIARIVYIPLYLLGVPYVRSLVWVVAMLGLLLMLIRFV